jgi:hypothetical protein
VNGIAVPSVPSSLGKFINDMYGWAVDVDLKRNRFLSPHHRGSPSTSRGSATA